MFLKSEENEIIKFDKEEVAKKWSLNNSAEKFSVKKWTLNNAFWKWENWIILTIPTSSLLSFYSDDSWLTEK